MIMKKTKKKTTLTCLQMYNRNDDIFVMTLFATFPIMFGTIALMDYSNKFINGLGDILFFAILFTWFMFVCYRMNIASMDFDVWIRLYNKKYEYVGDE